MPRTFVPSPVRAAALAFAWSPLPAVATAGEFAFTPFAWSLFGVIALLVIVVAGVWLWHRQDAPARVIAATPRFDEPVGVASGDEPAAAAAVPATAAPLGRVHDDSPADGAGTPAPPPETAAAAPVARTEGPPHPAPTGIPVERGPPAVALHHIDLSIDVLRHHIAGEPRPMPAVWVMLLDLCRTHGREETFREIAAEFHHRFNVCAPSWERYPPDRSEPGLEAYPRILRELTQSWGTPECRRLLDMLLYDNRRGGRRGFTMNAYNDLIALRRAAESMQAAIVRTAAAGGAAATRSLEDPPAAAVQSLAGEWASSALASRLDEMLARSGDAGSPAGSDGHAELLRGMARRLAEVHRIAVDVDP